MARAGEVMADQAPDRGETNINAAQKKYKPSVSIAEAHSDTQFLAVLVAAADKLEY